MLRLLKTWGNFQITCHQIIKDLSNRKHKLSSQCNSKIMYKERQACKMIRIWVCRSVWLKGFQASTEVGRWQVAISKGVFQNHVSTLWRQRSVWRLANVWAYNALNSTKCVASSLHICVFTFELRAKSSKIRQACGLITLKKTQTKQPTKNKPKHSCANRWSV